MIERNLKGRNFRIVFWFTAAVFMLFLAGALGIATAEAMRIDRVSFENSTGKISLTRTRARLGRVVRFETWQQPTSFSYSMWVPFQVEAPVGRELSCTAAVKGWLRTDLHHRNLVDFSCTCEWPRLHHNRALNCTELLR